MGFFSNLFSQQLAGPKLPTFRKLSSDTYARFTKSSEFAVILFDAAWDVGGGKAIRPSLQGIVQTHSNRVQFAEVDIDEHQDVPASNRLRQVQAIAYYRRGELVGLIGGQAQDISGHVAALLAGERVG